MSDTMIISFSEGYTSELLSVLGLVDIKQVGPYREDETHIFIDRSRRVFSWVSKDFAEACSNSEFKFFPLHKRGILRWLSPWVEEANEVTREMFEKLEKRVASLEQPDEKLVRPTIESVCNVLKMYEGKYLVDNYEVTSPTFTTLTREGCVTSEPTGEVYITVRLVKKA